MAREVCARRASTEVPPIANPRRGRKRSALPARGGRSRALLGAERRIQSSASGLDGATRPVSFVKTVCAARGHVPVNAKSKHPIEAMGQSLGLAQFQRSGTCKKETNNRETIRKARMGAHIRASGAGLTLFVVSRGDAGA